MKEEKRKRFYKHTHCQYE